MSLDTSAIRARYPALTSGTAFFDGPGGSQTPQAVADAVAAALTGPLANRGPLTEASRRADEFVLEARQAMADLLGADPSGIVFGRSMTALTYELARTLGRGWQPGDEIVLSRLDHDANIRPWLQMAAEVDVQVRWVDFDTRTGELPVEAVAEQIGDRTRLVALTGASNLIGTRPDIPAVTALAREAGALSFVDGVHLTPHAPVDVDELGADLFACSPYKFGGPHLGVVAGSSGLLEELHPDKLLPSPESVPERFERGTLPYELLAGVTAAVDELARLTPQALDQEPGRQQELRTSLTALETHEEHLRQQAERGLAQVDGLAFYSLAVQRTPTLLFDVEGVESAHLAEALAHRGVNAPAGSFYAIEASRHLGLGDSGAIRAGIAPYTSEEDVQRLVDGVQEAVAELR